MTRAPFQILVFPYRILRNKKVLYAIFKRKASTGGFWQGIAGGGEGDESPLQAARREAFEEAGIPKCSKYIKLDSFAMIPVVDVCGFVWGNKILVIPEYCFGVKIENAQLQLSEEHVKYKWVSYNTAKKMLRWDSNKIALWELNFKIVKALKKKRYHLRGLSNSQP
ncbi:MAG: NUDIX pyrophosphatase [candidate division WOR-3 bacterium]